MNLTSETITILTQVGTACALVGGMFATVRSINKSLDGLKDWVKTLTETVNHHSERLAVIEAQCRSLHRPKED